MLRSLPDKLIFRCLRALSVALSRKPYEIIVGNGILRSTGELVREILPAGKCASSHRREYRSALRRNSVWHRLGKQVSSLLVITIPAGEKSKSLSIAETVCDRMISAGLDRGSFVAALGGGVIGDLAGFVASIYYRGIPHVQIPTTVVAQVDSAIGGKTGVNAREGKNLIGSFHQPVLVIADPETLRSLPEREFNEGIAEIIKHAVIRDAAMLDDLARLVKRRSACPHRAQRKDQGRDRRRGRIRKTRCARAAEFRPHCRPRHRKRGRATAAFLHGEAVSLGIAAAPSSFRRKGRPVTEEAETVLEMLRAFDLPVHIPADIRNEAL